MTLPTPKSLSESVEERLLVRDRFESPLNTPELSRAAASDRRWGLLYRVRDVYKQTGRKRRKPEAAETKTVTDMDDGTQLCLLEDSPFRILKVTDSFVDMFHSCCCCCC